MFKKVMIDDSGHYLTDMQIKGEDLNSELILRLIMFFIKGVFI